MSAQIIPFPAHRTRRWNSQSLDRLLQDIKRLPPLVRQHGKPDDEPPRAA